jgi:hypothetical protein
MAVKKKRTKNRVDPREGIARVHAGRIRDPLIPRYPLASSKKRCWSIGETRPPLRTERQ